MYKKMALCLLSLSLLMPFGYALEEKDSTLSIEYSMTKSIAPDTATIKFYVENTGMNVADIKERNDKIVNDAISKIKPNLGEKEQIKTVAYRVNNIYSYKDKVRIFQKYEVLNGFEVKLKDLNKVSKIIKIAIDSGVKRVENLSFTLENPEIECNNLLAQTAKGAKTRAQVVASSLGETLGGVKHANPYCSTNSISRPRYFNSMAKGEADSAQTTQMLETIEPGEINLKANINMTYYLK